MKKFMLRSALAIFFAGIATAQQTTAAKKAPVSTKARPETKEHKFVKAQLAETQRRYDQVDAMMKEPKKDTTGYSSEQLQAEIDRGRRMIQLYGDLIVEVARQKSRLEHVDACTALFHRTIDKKTSDLTVRETTLVKDCTAMDLYPLDVTPQTEK